MKSNQHIRWLRLGLLFFSLVVLSLGLAYLLQVLIAKSHFPLYSFAWLAYLLVFGLSILANMSIVVPVPIATSIMIAAATKWDPVLLALAGSIGGSIGELSGYFAGYLGKKVAIPQDVRLYQMIERWIQKYGLWAIMFLALQPVIPFDVGGFIAGVAKMPIRKFLPALWLGKFPKYIILTYAGIGLIHFLPSWLQ
jgi:uncharacterized membrane protein YdjX (TVP38/TMEM64 family)